MVNKTNKYNGNTLILAIYNQNSRGDSRIALFAMLLLLNNTQILLLDENGQLSPAGEPGEICIRGSRLTHGYYADPERTKEAFVQNPLNPYYPERIYRTGDIGKYNCRGELMFLSRKDNQIKHMGHRIELGEIEAAANSHEAICSSCCVFV